MKGTALLISNTAWSVFNFRWNLLEMVRRSGMQPVVCAARDGYSRDISAAYGFVHLRTLAAHGTSPLGDIRLLFELIALMRRIRPSLVLTFTIKPNIYGALAAHFSGVRAVICTVNGLGRATASLGFVGMLTRRLYSISMRYASSVVFQNADDRNFMVRRRIVPGSKTSLTAGSGVDLERFRAEIREKSAGHACFLFCGRILKSKGAVLFAEAARQVKSEFPFAEFRLMGALSGPDHDGISLRQLQQWESEGWVTYLGEARDVRPILASADVVVLPSFYPEGVPRILIEALASAKPVVTTDRPGCRDTVDEGQNGFLVPPRNLNALVAAIREMVLMPNDRYRAMCVRSREKAERQFDESLVLDKYANLIGAAG